MKKGLIYCLICPITKNYRYVGKTTGKLKDRLAKHKYDIEYFTEQKSHKLNWLRKLKKLFILDELQIVQIEKIEISDNDLTVLNEKEIYWIKYFKEQGCKLTNTTLGGEGILGYKHTNETKEKISEASKKRKGTKASEEAKQNISLSLIGNTRRLNKPHTDETKQKISNSRKGKKPWNIKKIYQYTLNNEFIKEWESATFAAKELNLSQGNIAGVAEGIRRQTGGFIWKYNK